MKVIPMKNTGEKTALSDQAADSRNKMGVMPMPQLLLNMSLPMMVSLLVQSLYNIVDSIFVARISEAALTAASLAFPVQILMIAVSVGTSVGVNALLSRSVGAKDYEKTGNIAMTGLLLALAGMAVFVILGIFGAGTFAQLYTDDPVIADYCRQYLRICMLFCAGTFVGTMYQRFLQSVGNTFDSMLSLIAGAVTNLILDPLLIFGIGIFPEMGIRGAAIATVIGQWVNGAVAIRLNQLHNPVIRPEWKGYRPEKDVMMQIYKVGLPTIITQAMGSVMVTSINGILMPFSSTAVAFFGVYYKLQNFLFMPMNGLGQAAIPIAGYNYGAGNRERIRQLFRTILPAAVGIALAATVIFQAVPDRLLWLFSAGDTMMEMGVPALRIISCTFAFAAVTSILGYTVSGLGNGMVNMAGTALRQFILLVPAVYLLARYAGISNVWYGMWISETAAFLYAVMKTRRILTKLL